MNDYTKKTLNEYISFTESTLKKFSYKNKLGLQSSVADAMDYSLEAGGKRIRPVLVLAFCHMCGGDYRKAAAPAAAEGRAGGNGLPCPKYQGTVQIRQPDSRQENRCNRRKRAGGKESVHQGYGDLGAEGSGYGQYFAGTDKLGDKNERYLQEDPHVRGSDGKKH